MSDFGTFFGLTTTKRLMMWLMLVTLGIIALVFCTSIGDIHAFVGHRRPSVRSPEKTWTWSCEDHLCVRREWLNNVTLTWSSLPTCRVTCDQTTYIWPKPTGRIVISKRIRSFHLSHVRINIQRVIERTTRSLLREACKIFRENLQALVPDEDMDVPDGVADVVVHVNLYLRNGAETSMTLDTNESYKLVIRDLSEGQLTVTIEADCFFGVRHALETLSQLMWWESDERGSGTFKVLGQVLIEDHPAFNYRGIMIDTSRNFIPLADLRTTINGMAASKLNTLHLHLTDSQSFSFESTRYPQMSRYGAYAHDKVYSAADLRALAAYARVRGVRLLPEMDAPAHTAAGWQWGREEGLGELAVCVNKEPWATYCGEPPCGQLNPSNNNTYHVLRGIYEDLIEVTGNADMFHIGGDEVNAACWKNSTEVFTDAEKLDPKSFNRKVIEFHNRAYEELRAANNGTPIENVIVWSSEVKRNVLTQAFPPSSYIIQEWLGYDNYIELNYRVIVSHVSAWYLDCGFGSWKLGHAEPCAPVTTWQNVYSYRPWESYQADHMHQVLGGEVCLWSEMVDASTVDARVWPRAAALAERLWTDPSARGVWLTKEDIIKDAMLRLSVFRDRLVTRGVKADAMWPQWCADNPEACF